MQKEFEDKLMAGQKDDFLMKILGSSQDQLENNENQLGNNSNSLGSNQNPLVILFKQIMKIIFSIVLNTLNSSKKNAIDTSQFFLDQIDELLKTVSKDLLYVDESILNIVYAVFFLITGKETQSMKQSATKFDKKTCLIVRNQHN